MDTIIVGGLGLLLGLGFLIGVAILIGVVIAAVSRSKKNSNNVMPGGKLGRRIGAYIIDDLVAGGIYLIVAAIIGICSNPNELLMAIVNQEYASTLFEYRLIMMSFPIIYILYGTLLESGKKQATLGKRATKLVVVKLNGEKANLLDILVRNIMKVLPNLVAAVWFGGSILFTIYGIVAIVIVLVTKKHRGIHDYVGKTLVANREDVGVTKQVYGADAVHIEIPRPQVTPAPQPVYTARPQAAPVEERKILATGGQYEGAQFTIDAPIIMGISPKQCHIVFEPETPEVNEVHCEVKCEKGIVYLKDIGASYGTLVNEERILRTNEMIELQVGDTFRLGKYETFIIK